MFFQELIQLRDGMAHGIIAEINKSGIDQIIKFKELKDKSGIKVEFIMSLEIKKLIKIQKSLIELRRHIMKLSGDKK